MSQAPEATQFLEAVAAGLVSEGALVDAYGALKAEAAAIEAKLEAIKEALKATGKDEFRNGAMFDATMSISNRETVSVKELRAGLGPVAEQFIKRSKDTYTLRCVAKKS